MGWRSTPLGGVLNALDDTLAPPVPIVYVHAHRSREVLAVRGALRPAARVLLRRYAA